MVPSLPVTRPSPDADRQRLIALERRRKAEAICQAHPEASFENVWHSLVLLELPPIERLNRSLTRGRAAAARR